MRKHYLHVQGRTKKIMSGDNDSTQDFQFYLIFCYKLNMKEKKMYITR